MSKHPRYKVELNHGPNNDYQYFHIYKESGISFFKRWNYISLASSLEKAKEIIELDKNKVVYISD